MLYDSLTCNACADLEIRELPLKYGLKGVYYDGRVVIDSTLSHAEKACILAEELGHHYTSAGNIIDLSDLRNRKQELIARAWAYRLLLPVSAIIQACLNGLRSTYELAEEFGVTEPFVKAAIAYYQAKYGLYVKAGQYLLYFDPLRVEKRGD
jgi:hypothetical protein